MTRYLQQDRKHPERRDGGGNRPVGQSPGRVCRIKVDADRLAQRRPKDMAEDEDTRLAKIGSVRPKRIWDEPVRKSLEGGRQHGALRYGHHLDTPRWLRRAILGAEG